MNKVSIHERRIAEVSFAKVSDTELCISKICFEEARFTMTSAEQTGSSQVSLLKIYVTQIRPVENCITKVKPAKRYPSVLIKLTSLSKYLGEVDEREARAEVMQLTPLVPSRFAFKNP